MTSKRQILCGLLGVLFTLQGLSWLLVPKLAAGSLGMPLLDGIGRSTQVGDFTAFFLILGLSILAGAVGSRAHLLYFPAALLGGAAVCRMFAWAVHGAEFATLFITVEIAASVLLLSSAHQLDDDA